MAALLSPLLRFYLLVLYPLARPSAAVLDRWLGQEGLSFYRERDLREVIRRHIDVREDGIDRLEGIGALNFLEIDDLAVDQASMEVDEASIVSFPFAGDGEDAVPILPDYERTPQDPFLERLHVSGRHFVVVTDLQGEPRLVLDADGFLRAALFDDSPPDPRDHLYRPHIVRDPHTRLGNVLARLGRPSLSTTARGEDIVLVWTDPPRLIAGDDILRQLLRGVDDGVHDDG